MSYFGLDPTNENQLLDTAARNPAGVKSDIGFFSNTFGASAAGLYSGLVAKPDQLLWAGVDTVVSPISSFVNENTPLNDTSAEFIRNQRNLAQQQVKRLTPDAATTGTAGQVLNGLFDLGSQAIVGTLLTGPVGAAAAVTSLQGFSEFEKLRSEGVDLSTAQDVALVHGITSGVGTLLPMSIGLRAGGALAEGVGAQIARTGESVLGNAASAVARSAPDIAYAAGTNVAMGMALRGATASTLRGKGYDDMADQYDVFDRQSLAIDAVLGVAFGGLGRFINSRGENVRPPEFAPADVDAALAANAAQHAEFDVAPGVPINVLSRNAHVEALQKAMRDVSEGNPVDVANLVEPAAFSEVPGRKNLIALSLDEALATADEGSAAMAAETRLLEEQSSQLMSRGDRKVLASEIHDAEYALTELETKRQALKDNPATTSSARRIRNRDVAALDKQIEPARTSLEQKRQQLADHSEGGIFQQARAEVTRRQQSAADLDAQALSYYKTAEVRTLDEAAPFDTGKAIREADPAAKQDIDVKYAEDSLANSPDMMITVIDNDGNPQSRSAREALDEVTRESDQAVQDSNLFEVAVSCFLRS